MQIHLQFMEILRKNGGYYRETYISRYKQNRVAHNARGIDATKIIGLYANR